MQGRTSLFAIVMLLALSLRILLPAGYMPSTTPDGLVLELCSGAGGATFLAADEGSGEDDGPAAKDVGCVFATNPGHLIAAPQAVSCTVPVSYGAVLSMGGPIADLTINRLAAPPPPACGPPALS